MQVTKDQEARLQKIINGLSATHVINTTLKVNALEKMLSNEAEVNDAADKALPIACINIKVFASGENFSIAGGAVGDIELVRLLVEVLQGRLQQ